MKWWVTQYRNWLNLYKGPLHIVRYERLKSHLVDELRALMNFLGWNISESHLQCVGRNSEGRFHRKKKAMEFDPWNSYNGDNIEEILSRIDRWPHGGEI